MSSPRTRGRPELQVTDSVADAAAPWASSTGGSRSRMTPGSRRRSCSRWAAREIAVIHAYIGRSRPGVERRAIERDGDATLMRRASWAVADEIAERLPSPLARAAGGAAGRVRQQRRGRAVRGRVPAPARARRDGGAVTDSTRRTGRTRGAAHARRTHRHSRSTQPWRRSIAAADVIVDGLVGLSAKPPLRPTPPTTWSGMANATDALRVAVDLPSGIEPDTGIGPRDRVPRRCDGDVRRHQVRPADRRRADGHDRLRPHRHGHDRAFRPDVIAMTDGAVERLLPDPPPESRQVLRRPGRHRRRLARLPGRAPCSAPAERCGPAGHGPLRRGAGLRGARSLARGGGRPRRRGRPARCRPGSSVPGMGTDDGPQPGCAGCSIRTSRCWSTRTG